MILLGDAAHAVTPIGGQGCNAALEDGVVLERVLAEAGTGLLYFYVEVESSVQGLLECWTHQ